MNGGSARWKGGHVEVRKLRVQGVDAHVGGVGIGHASGLRWLVTFDETGSPGSCCVLDLGIRALKGVLVGVVPGGRGRGRVGCRRGRADGRGVRSCKGHLLGVGIRDRLHT